MHRRMRKRVTAWKMKKFLIIKLRCCALRENKSQSVGVMVLKERSDTVPVFFETMVKLIDNLSISMGARW
jgi:hypothetical protein